LKLLAQGLGRSRCHRVLLQKQQSLLCCSSKQTHSWCYPLATVLEKRRRCRKRHIALDTTPRPMACRLMLNTLRSSRKKNRRLAIGTWLILVHPGYANWKCVAQTFYKKIDSLFSFFNGFSHSRRRFLCRYSHVLHENCGRSRGFFGEKCRDSLVFMACKSYSFFSNSHEKHTYTGVFYSKKPSHLLTFSIVTFDKRVSVKVGESDGFLGLQNSVLGTSRASREKGHNFEKP
jgi:hypothetical protein